MAWAIAGATIVSGGLQYAGGQQAAETSAAGTQAGINEQGRQFDTANRLNQPFYQAAAGTSLAQGVSQQDAELMARARSGETLSREDQVRVITTNMRLLQRGVTPDQIDQSIEHITNPQQGALSQLQEGIDQAPEGITIDQFTGQAVAAPAIDRFQGQAVDAPQLNRFGFNVQDAMNSPEMQFQRQMGEQQIDRVAGKNRQLGSGQRLLEAQKFGQGLATQSIGDQFNRQLQTNKQQQGTDVAQFGLGSQNLQQRQTLNALGNQQGIQQQNLDRQFLSDEQALNALKNKQMMEQYGIDSGVHNERMNRLTDLVKVGTGASNTMGTNAMNTGTNVSNMLTAGANTQAAQQLGQSNIIGGTLTSLANQYGQYQQNNPAQPQPNLTTAQQYGTVPNSQQTNMLANQWS